MKAFCTASTQSCSPVKVNCVKVRLGATIDNFELEIGLEVTIIPTQSNVTRDFTVMIFTLHIIFTVKKAFSEEV